MTTETIDIIRGYAEMTLHACDLDDGYYSYDARCRCDNIKYLIFNIREFGLPIIADTELYPVIADNVIRKMEEREIPPSLLRDNKVICDLVAEVIEDMEHALNDVLEYLRGKEN